MKTHNYIFVINLLVFFHINVLTFGQQSIDSTQIRYIKFTTTVDASTPQVYLNEIKAFVNGENVASGQSVTMNSFSSDSYTSKIVDDNTNTSWMSDSYSTLTNNQYGATINHPHWITVDLGNTYNLDSLKLDINGGGTWTFNYSFDFLVSTDANNWSLVDHEDNARGVFLFKNIPITNIRYVKYACYFSSDMGQVNVEEIQAYSNGVNVAQNKSVSVSSGSGSSAVDGNSGSRWSSSRSDHISDSRASTGTVSAMVDLGSIQTIDSLSLTYSTSTIFKLLVSTDGYDWLQLDQRLNENNTYSYLLNRLPKVASEIISYGESSITCKIIVDSDGGSAVTETGICWSTSPNPTILDNKIIGGAGIGNFTIEIPNLVTNNLYYIRAYAINANGTNYSPVHEILFGLQIETDVISEIEGYSATSGGFVSSVNGVQILDKGVCWSTSKRPTIANNHVSANAGSGDFTSLLTNLNSGINYFVRAYATTNSATVYGEEYYFKIGISQYIASYDGFFGDHIFSENGTYNNQKYYTSQYGSSLFYEDGYWLLDGWVTSEDSGNPPLTGWWDGTVLELVQTPKATISYDKDTLTEATLNNGSISEILTITHDNTSGAEFTGVNNEDFVATGKAIVRNLPSGLEASLIRINNTTLHVVISGNATSHAQINSVNNVKIMLKPTAFSTGQSLTTAGNCKIIDIQFSDPTGGVVTGIDKTPYVDSSNPFALVQDSKVFVKNLKNASTIQIYDATGKILQNIKTDNETYEMPLNQTGLYLVKIYSNNGNWSYKLLNR